MARKVNAEGTKKRREQILNAAHACFVKKGFHMSSMADICKRARLSPGTVYHYFKSKEDIILQFAEKELQQSREFAAALGLASTLDELVVLAVDVVLANVEPMDSRVYLEVLCEGGRNPKIGKRLLEADAVVDKAFEKKLKQLGARSDVSMKSLATFVGGQVVFLELFKSENPSSKAVAEVSRLTKAALRHVLLGD